MGIEETLIKLKNKEVWLKILKKPSYDFTISFNQPYVCILFVNDTDITNEIRTSISKKIIDTNCKYVICAGHQCSLWEDSVDMAHISRWQFNPPEAEHVMTTCHKNETIEEVLWFGFNLTNFDHHVFEKYVILILGENDNLESEIIKILQNFV